MKRFICSYMLLFFAHIFLSGNKNLPAQNLIKNPSFENYIQCPQTFNLFNGYIEDWYGLNSSFYHSCSSPPQVPINSMGYQNARTGDGYVHIKVFAYYFNPDRRTYIQANLSSLLLKDKYYCVSYYVSLTENSGGATKNVDAYFSDTLVKWTSNNHGKVLQNIKPQIKSIQMLNDSINWLRVNGIYKAKGGEKHLTIGNFLPDNHTTVLNFSPEDAIQVHYFIDDVSVEPLNITLPSLGNDTTICKNKTPYTLAAPPGYDSYEWSNGDTNTSIQIYDEGDYWVKCKLDGCGVLSDTIQISFFDSPDLELGADTTICKGSNLKLSVQKGFASYLWNTSESTSDIIISKAGTYILTVKDQCSVQTDTISIVVDSVPDLKIDIGNDTTLCNNGENFSLTLTSNLSLPNYSWSNGSTSKEISINKKGDYWLESYFPCGVLKSNIVFVDGCPPDTIEMYIPNSFTPNGDGLNDLFFAVPQNVEIFDLKIFNRWGEMIYKSQNHYTWDGNCYGEPCQSGIYVYTIRYKDKNNILGQRSGTINLMK